MGFIDILAVSELSNLIMVAWTMIIATCVVVWGVDISSTIAGHVPDCGEVKEVEQISAPANKALPLPCGGMVLPSGQKVEDLMEAPPIPERWEEDDSDEDTVLIQFQPVILDTSCVAEIAIAEGEIMDLLLASGYQVVPGNPKVLRDRRGRFASKKKLIKLAS